MKKLICAIAVVMIMGSFTGAKAIESFSLSPHITKDKIAVKRYAEAEKKITLLNAAETKLTNDIKQQELSVYDETGKVPALAAKEKPEFDANKKKLIEEYKKSLAAIKTKIESIKSNLDTSKSDEVGLKALRVGGGLQANSGKQSTTFVPVLDFSGQIELKQEKFPDSVFSIKTNLNIKPDAGSGNSEEVAQSIRIDNGTFSLREALCGAFFLAPPDTVDGPIGLEVNIAANIAYQKVSNVTTPTQNATGDNVTVQPVDDFGIVSSEARIGLWLKYFYTGYKYSYFSRFGKPNIVANEFDGTSSHNLIIITKIESLSGDKSEDENDVKNKNPFYLELKYTGGKDTFGNGTFTFSAAKAFNGI